MNVADIVARLHACDQDKPVVFVAPAKKILTLAETDPPVLLFNRCKDGDDAVEVYLVGPAAALLPGASSK